jgi:hypothetical protein
MKRRSTIKTKFAKLPTLRSMDRAAKKRRLREINAGARPESKVV